MTTIDEYRSIRPELFGPIVAAEFTQEEKAEGVEQRFRVVLSRRPELSGEKMTITFYGVRELVFRQPTLSLADLGLIEIVPNGDDYLVTEEDGNLRLICSHFDAARS